MKKFLLVLIPLCMCIGFTGTSFAQLVSGWGSGGYWGGGYTNIIVIPTPGGGGRSITLDVVTATMDFDAGQIVVDFSEPVGKATVAIEDAMGRRLLAYDCDTAAEWEVSLPIPNVAGHYRLVIEGGRFNGIGEFDLGMTAE